VGSDDHVAVEVAVNVIVEDNVENSGSRFTQLRRALFN
jgi:hypothetical protein